MRRPLFALAIGGALLVPAAAFAQGSEGASAQTAPAGRSEGQIVAPTFDLEISGEDSSAAVEFGGYARRDNSTGDRQVNEIWSARLEVPIGGKDDLTARDTLDALRNGPSVTLGYSWYRFRSTADNLQSEAFTRLMDRARVACREEEDDDSRCNPPINVAGFARHYLGEYAVNRVLNHDIWRYGLQGQAGINRFGYIEAGTLDRRHDMELQLSASAFLAWYPANGTNALIARAEYQDAWEAADSAIICRPVVVTPATDCVSGAPTPPEHVQRLNASLEYRQVFSLTGRRFYLALSPRATVDTLSGDYRLDLPIYLIPRTDMPILPGITISYSSEKEDVAFALVLRASFSLTR